MKTEYIEVATETGQKMWMECYIPNKSVGDKIGDFTITKIGKRADYENYEIGVISKSIIDRKKG